MIFFQNIKFISSIKINFRFLLILLIFSSIFLWYIDILFWDFSEFRISGSQKYVKFMYLHCLLNIFSSFSTFSFALFKEYSWYKNSNLHFNFNLCVFFLWLHHFLVRKFGFMNISFIFPTFINWNLTLKTLWIYKKFTEFVLQN